MGRELRRGDVLLVPDGDPWVAELAGRQHGVVSTAQLHAAGIEHDAVALRVRRGRLHRMHRGVYAVGHPRVTLRGRWWAAVLACGGVERAALSHRAAAALWDLLPTPSGPVDVMTLRRSGSSPGVRVHRSRTLDPARDVDRDDDGLPVTTPSRTLVDLAVVLAPHALTRTVHRAEQLRLLDARALAGVRSRPLRAALETLAYAGPDVTRSELEERFLALVAGHGLPLPRTNVRVADHEVDFLWPEHDLVAETDGAAAHLTPTAFERDRARDAALLLAGFRTVRFTHRQVVDDPGGVAAAVSALLGVRPAPAGPTVSSRRR